MDTKKEKSKEVSTEMVVGGVVTRLDNAAQPLDTTQSFDQHVARFKSEILNNRKRSLRIVWEIGTFVNLLKAEKVYGGATVDKFVQAMGDDAVNIKEVYKWAQFAEAYDIEAVNRLLGMSNMSWSVVSNLIRVRDPEVRLALETQVDAGEVRPSKLQDVVSEYNKAIAQQRAASTTPASSSEQPQVNKCVANFRKLNNFLDSILTTAEPCAKDINDLSAILDNEKLYETAVAEMEAYLGRLDSVRQVINGLEDQLNKTI